MTIKKARAIEKTIDAYSLALGNEQDLIEKARILEKLADNYYELALANHEDRRSSLLKAIQAYLEALEIRTLEQFPMDYARTQNNLGAAYANFGRGRGQGPELQEGHTGLPGGSQNQHSRQFPRDYAMAQNNLGSTYRTLAEVEDKDQNCQKAIKAYQEALKISTLEHFPMNYAMTQNNLGSTYRILAEVEDKDQNCQKAIKAYQEALKISTLDQFPMDYAMTQNNLGAAYELWPRSRTRPRTARWPYRPTWRLSKSALLTSSPWIMP